MRVCAGLGASTVAAVRRGGGMFEAPNEDEPEPETEQERERQRVNVRRQRLHPRRPPQWQSRTKRMMGIPITITLFVHRRRTHSFSGPSRAPCAPAPRCFCSFLLTYSLLMLLAP